MKYKVIDLFAGVGGMSLGFEMAGFDVVLANEYDKDIATAYKKNHSSTKMINEDITKLDLQSVFEQYKGNIDVIIGGPPCQGFSQKGKRKTIHDERNFLFKYYVKVVDLVKPQYFVMENVPNLLTAEKGYFNHRWSLVTMPSAGEGDEIQDYKFEARSEYQKKMRMNSNKLLNHKATNHSKLALERLALVPPEQGKECLPEEHLTKSIYSGTWCRMQKDDVSVTITTRFDTPSSGRFTHPYLNRAITVREAARIQSFPDTFEFVGPKVSQMKQVGNAVPPLLANKIADSILNDIT